MDALPPDRVAIPVRRIGYAADAQGVDETRTLPAETPIAVEVNGIGYAVMMATPADLGDFALGFAMAEGLASARDELLAVDAHAAEGGVVLRLTLPPEAAERAVERARTRLSESSCGLCGIDSIAEVLRPTPSAPAPPPIGRPAVAAALAALRSHQLLGQATGATHAAAFCDVHGAIRLAREDVGRHNALDKLVGAMAHADLDPASGFVLLSARCSYELVEKAVRAGVGMLVTISAATSLAAERARAAELTLATVARDDTMLVVHDPHGRLA